MQARMTSTRLPGKVLADLAGRPMLEQQLRRLESCRSIDEVVIATTSNATDDAIAELARELGTLCFRGSESDVLGRFLGAARQTQADVVVRATADCPLIDAGVVDRVVDELVSNAAECDYASNTIRRTFPRGLDVEALFVDTLERIGRLGTSIQAREHVTYFLTTERPDLFETRGVVDERNNADLRWTVDTLEDLAFVRAVYDEMQLDLNRSPFASIVDFVRARPDLIRINAAIEQKTF